MAISKLDFARGQVVNPLDSIGDDLLKFGSSLHQQDKDRLAAERQNEMLDMQKQEHQMKVDEVNNTKKYYELLNKPLEMKDTAALYNNMTALQPYIDKMTFTDDEVLASTPVGAKLHGTETVVTPEMVADAQKRVDPLAFASKQKAQGLLGEFGSTMSQKEEYQPTHLEQLGMIAKQMGGNTPTILAKEMEAARLAAREKRILDEKTYTKEIADAGNDSVNTLLAQAIRSENKNGSIIGYDGTTGEPIYGTGNNSGKKVGSVEDFYVEQAKNADKLTRDAFTSFSNTATARIGVKDNPLNRAQAEAFMGEANTIYKELVSRKYPADVAAKFVNDLIEKTDPTTGGLFGAFKDKNTLKLGDAQQTMLDDSKRLHDATINAEYLRSARKDGAVTSTYKDIIPAPKAATENVMNIATGIFGDKKLGAAVTSRATAESGLNPYEAKLDTNNKMSMGILQWNGPRIDDYNQWAKDNKKALLTLDGKTVNRASTVQEQLEFAKYESEHKEKAAWDKVKAAPSVYEAGSLLSKEVVRPGDEDNNATRTGRYAQVLVGETPNSVLQAPQRSVTANDVYGVKIANDVARKEKAKQDLALSRMSPDEKIRASVLGNVAGFAGGVLPSRDMAVVNAPKVDTTIAAITPKAQQEENRFQFNRLLNKENKTPVELDQMETLARKLNINMPTKTGWKSQFPDDTKPGVLPAHAAPNFDAAKAVPTRAGWAHNLEDVLTNGRAGRDLGLLVKDMGNRALQAGTAAGVGLLDTAKFFTQPWTNYKNYSDGTNYRNTFDVASEELANYSKKLLIDRGVSDKDASNAVTVQSVLTPIGIGSKSAILSPNMWEKNIAAITEKAYNDYQKAKKVAAFEQAAAAAREAAPKLLPNYKALNPEAQQIFQRAFNTWENAFRQKYGRAPSVGEIPAELREFVL